MTSSKSRFFHASLVMSLSLLLLQSVQLQAATYYVKSFKAGVFDAPGIHGKTLHTFNRGESVEGPDLKVVYQVAEQLGVAITEVMKYTVDEIKGLISKLELVEEGKLTGAEEADRFLPGQKVQQSEGWLQVTWEGDQGWMRKKTLSPRPIREKIVLDKKKTDTDEKKKVHFRMRVHQLEKENSAKQGDLEFNLSNPDENSVDTMESFVQDEEFSVNFLLSGDS